MGSGQCKTKLIQGVWKKKESRTKEEKKIAEQDGDEQDGRKASGKTRTANLIKKNNQIQI